MRPSAEVAEAFKAFVGLVGVGIDEPERFDFITYTEDRRRVVVALSPAVSS